MEKIYQRGMRGAVCVLFMLFFAIEAKADIIAAWKNQPLKANPAVTADEGNWRNKEVATMQSDKTLDQAGTYTYGKKSSAGGTTITIENLNLKGYTDIQLTFYAYGNKMAAITSYPMESGITQISQSTEEQYTITAIPNTTTSIILKYSGSSSTTSGNDFHFGTVEISGTKVELPQYTVSFSTGDAAEEPTALTEEVGGEGVTLPDLTMDCANWEFVGWAETAISTATASISSKNLYAAGTVYEPEEDCTLYAVYRQTMASGTTLPDSVVLWSEDFSHFGTQKPSVAGMGSGTTTYEGASITYYESGGTVKGYEDTKAGGVSPELYIATGGYYGIQRIPTGEVEKMQLTFKSSAKTWSVTATEKVSCVGAGNSWILTIPEGVKTFTLQIANNGSSTARIDDVVLMNYAKADTAYLSSPTCTDQAVQVESITLYHTEQTLQEGDSCYISARVSPTNAWNKQLNYTVCDEAFATMDGIRLRVGKGNALIGEQTVILVSAADGSGVSATCTLTVSEANYHIYTDELHRTAMAAFGTEQHAIGRTQRIKGTHPFPSLSDTENGTESGETDCSLEYYRFAGWAESPIADAQTTVPEDLTEAGTSVTPTENKTYYAVWTDGTNYLTRCTGEYKRLPMQVVEWYADKIVVAYDHSAHTIGSSLTATLNGTTVSATLTEQGGNLAEIAISGIGSHPDEEWVFGYTATDGTVWQSDTFLSPALMANEVNTSTAQTHIGSLVTADRDGFDIAVRDRSVLTIDGQGKQNTFGTLTVHPTAKVIVPEGKTLTLDTLVLRSGVAEVGGTTEKDSIPQLYLAGNLVCKAIVYEMRVCSGQYYGFSLPYEVNCADIQRVYDPSNAGLTNTNFSLLYYNGELRAAQNSATDDVWADVSGTLSAGKGYIVAADPVAGESSTLLRFPMAGFSTAAGETLKQVTVDGWEDTQATGVRDNHKGWNLVANPYMATYVPASSGEEDDAFSGAILSGEDKVRYLTLPNSDYSGFTQMSVQDADLRLLPFKNFFVQIDGNEQTMSFAIDNRQQPLAALRASRSSADEIETGVRLTDGRETDYAGLLIDDAYGISRSDGVRNDVPKAPAATSLAIYTLGYGSSLALNALSRSDARERIPLGICVAAAGQYRIEYNESFLAGNGDIEAIWVEDNGVRAADLLQQPYLFSAKQGTDEDRFALRLLFKGDSDSATAIEEMYDSGTGLQQYTRIQVYDAMGRLLLTTGTGLPNTTAVQQQPTTTAAGWAGLHLPQGVYTIRLTNSTHTETRKVVISHEQ